MLDNYVNMRLISFNMQLKYVDIFRVHINKSHVKKLHLNKIMLHVTINILHVDTYISIFACRHNYVTEYMLTIYYSYVDKQLTCIFVYIQNINITILTQVDIDKSIDNITISHVDIYTNILHVNKRGRMLTELCFILHVR